MILAAWARISESLPNSAGERSDRNEPIKLKCQQRFGGRCGWGCYNPLFIVPVSILEAENVMSAPMMRIARPLTKKRHDIHLEIRLRPAGRCSKPLASYRPGILPVREAATDVNNSHRPQGGPVLRMYPASSS